MEKSQQNEDRNLVFQYDSKILNEIVDALKSHNYKNIQYVPPLQSYLAIAKEHENILNFFSKKKHLLFYYSLFPKFYQFYLTKQLRICFDACFSNKYVSKMDLQKIFSESLIYKALANNILSKKENIG